MEKKKILMVCEAFGGGVFTYVSQLCNDMVDDFEVYLAYSLRPQTPKNYKEFLNQKVHLIKMKHVGVNGLINLKSDIAAIKELRQIEKNVKPDVIHLHSSVAGGLGRIAYSGKNNIVVYTPHGYAHILMGPGKKSTVYKFAEKVLGNRALTLTCCESEDAFVLCSLGEAIAMSLIENMYIKKLILVSNTIGNKSVIHNGINGYVCDTAEEYAKRIKDAMREFPKGLPEQAYQDVLRIYNTCAMKKKYIAFYTQITGGGDFDLILRISSNNCVSVKAVA